MSVRVEYYDVAVGAAEDAAITATGDTPALNDLTKLPFGAGGTGDIITTSHNQWVLDGTRVPRDGVPISFLTVQPSNAQCNFSTAPTITIEFDARYTSQGISLFFLGDAWCTSLNIKWYRGNTQLSSMNFTPTALACFCENAVESYDKVVITLNKTSLPSRRLMLDKILFGVLRSFDRSAFRSGSIKVLQEIDPTSRELAANALDMTLNSPSPVEYLFQYRQPVTAYDDNTLIGVFYVDKADRLGEKLYAISCIDAVGLLGDDLYPDMVLNDANAYALAQSICQGYDLTMEATLQGKTVKGVLVGKTRREALQQLCFAIGAVADTSGDTGIKIFKLPTTGAINIPTSRARSPKVIAEAVVTAVQLTAHSYSTTSSSGAEEITINGVTYYDTKTVTTVANPLATASDKPNVIAVSDATLISTDNVAEIAQLLYDQATRRETADLKFHVATETMGDLVTVPTWWGDTVTGNLVKATLTLSSFVLADAEVRGT